MIIPAIIPENIEDLETHLVQVRGLAKWVQIDVCDGRLTPQSCWPYSDDNGEFEEIVKQERGLPLWEDFDFEIDMMVAKPEEEYEKWIDAGASRLIFHYNEKKKDLLKDLITKTKDRGVEAGLALHYDHSVDIIEDFKDIIDSVQFMGIKEIGFQGEPFEDGVVKKIKNAKEKYPNIPISVDGGVNDESIISLKIAGTDRLIVGSALFNSFDIEDEFNALSEDSV